jgi:WD40-like Beta Propeller Repeat
MRRTMELLYGRRMANASRSHRLEMVYSTCSKRRPVGLVASGFFWLPHSPRHPWIGLETAVSCCFASADPNTGWDLRALPLTGGTPIGVAETSFSERNGQFSPDGRWVAFESNESGRFEISIQRFPEPGPKWQVSSGGGATPRWRDDGRELFYIAANGALMSADISVSKDGQSLDVSDVKQLFRAPIVFGGSPRDNNKEQFA